MTACCPAYLAIMFALAAGPRMPASGASAARLLDVATEQRLADTGQKEFTFALGELAPARQVRLALDVRFDAPSLTCGIGPNEYLGVAVNGGSVLGADLLNKPLEFTTRDGMDASWVWGSTWRAFASPDFSDAIKTQPIGLGLPDTDPYRFVWDITKHVRRGENKVVLVHKKVFAEPHFLVIRNLVVDVGEPVKSRTVEPPRPAPSGPVPEYVAKGRQGVDLEVSLSDGGSIRMKVAQCVIRLSSRTSDPDGKWTAASQAGWQVLRKGTPGTARWLGKGYEVERTVAVEGDHVGVADRIVNSTGHLAGVMIENNLELPAAEKPSIFLGGRKAFGESAELNNPAHPTAIGVWRHMAIGLVAEDDIFRVHAMCSCSRTSLGLADRWLAIEPATGGDAAAASGSRTLQWSIYPVVGGDYWDVINSIRRNWETAVTLPGPGLFDGSTSTFNEIKTLAYYKELIATRRLKMIFSYNTVRPDGRTLACGPDIPNAKEWWSAAKEWVRRVHAVDPAVHTMLYIHPANCTEPGATEKYADCQILDAAGKQALSPYSYPIPEYLATSENRYGKALAATIARYFDEIGTDGIFMDEFSGGSIPVWAYGKPWDRCTAVIDPTTHAITATPATVILLQQSWKSQVIEYLRQRGKLIVGNGPPKTRTMLSWKVPTFSEIAGTYSNLIDTHLSCPWALGNYATENIEAVRMRMARRALDMGCVLAGYSWDDHPKAVHYLTLMYPITPVEMRPGVVFGKERIVTDRSGRFGWPEGGTADVYEFDASGQRVQSPTVRRLTENGRPLTELRMPSDHLAILVKKTENP